MTEAEIQNISIFDFVGFTEVRKGIIAKPQISLALGPTHCATVVPHNGSTRKVCISRRVNIISGQSSVVTYSLVARAC